MSDEDESNARKAKRKEKIERATKMMDLSKNPCLKEQKISLKCLSDNSYNKDLCRFQFENYKTCKEFWSKVESDRRRKGIQPLLPPPEERDEIKIKYMTKNQIPA